MLYSLVPVVCVLVWTWVLQFKTNALDGGAEAARLHGIDM
jgi:hypothetical protein